MPQFHYQTPLANLVNDRMAELGITRTALYTASWGPNSTLSGSLVALTPKVPPGSRNHPSGYTRWFYHRFYHPAKTDEVRRHHSNSGNHS